MDRFGRLCTRRGGALPLVLADEPSIFRRIALNAMEQARLPWHTKYVAPNLVGIRAAVSAGLSITARSVEFLSLELRVLGEKDGLLALPDVTYFLWIRDDLINPLIRHVYDMLIAQIGLSESASAQAGGSGSE